MTPEWVLREAKQVVLRAHTATQLAVDEHGTNVRPLDPRAVAWSSTGALGKVAPWMSATDEHVWFDLTPQANTAWDLLNEAARQQGHSGYARMVTADRAGLPAVLAMFEKALQLSPDAPRRVWARSAGTDSSPRGVEGVA